MTAGADRPEAVVVDASALVALVASRSVVADALGDRLRGARLYAPDVLRAETDSALRGLVLGRRLTEAQGDMARASAGAMGVDLWPWELLTDRAWELRHNLSSHDAGYVALAERLNAPLITGDARLAAAPGMRCVIELFG